MAHMKSRCGCSRTVECEQHAVMRGRWWWYPEAGNPIMDRIWKLRQQQYAVFEPGISLAKTRQLWNADDR